MGLPLPQFRRAWLDFHPHDKRLYTILLVGYDKPVTMSEFELAKLRRFCRRCESVLGREFPKQYSFWKETPDGFFRPSRKVWALHIAQQMKIGDQLHSEWEYDKHEIHTVWREATVKEQMWSHLEGLGAGEERAREERELDERFARLRSEVRLRNWSGKGLQARYLREKAAMEARWVVKLDLIAKKFEAQTARPTEAYRRAMADLEARLEVKRLELNAMLPPERPRPVKVPERRPGRPPAKRDRATELILSMDGCRVAELKDAAEANGVGWKAMVAAAKTLGVDKTGRRWRTIKLPLN
ncbi:hypothetical protein QO002_002911 [Pararhizobium capsulatum DSM 1112]|uniref:Uncharacterized protein n=1 Tax=Pararhizobium capsulatum DSM 1112 TaxID=1121113 RepID=A0ABU0BRA2_9HYPH|nr:hypothetical protein [Pararhizobium capsulatum]MDQ0320773.1 hypothetical protein [Pararhizobium capsulatum DSM 1112]